MAISGNFVWRNGLLLAALAILHPPCLAGAFSVSPVRVHFEARDRAQALTVVNEGDSPLRLEAELMRWTQDESGADRLEPTEELIVSPPLLNLPPRSRQVVRVALLAPRDGAAQRSYRLLVRERPPEPLVGADRLHLPIALVMSLPVFVTPEGARRQVRCELRRGDLHGLSCHNEGSAYAQLREIQLRQGGQVVARHQGSLYLLPGARRNWDLHPVPADGPLQAAGEDAGEVVLRFDDGRLQTMAAVRPALSIREP